jgi:hypothetical protein
MIFGAFGIGLVELIVLGVMALGLIGGALALFLVLQRHDKNHPYEQDE